MTREGLKVAIIERKLFGGTCVNVGCISTKALVASARAANMARRGAEFGVMLDGEVTVDVKTVKARKGGIVRQSNQGVTNWLKGMDNLCVCEGHGTLESANTVRVNDELLEADRIIINVGGRALVPEMPGVHDIPYLTNSTIMEVDFLAEHLIVVGGSYIGLEFAQIYRRFGSKVTVVQRNGRLVAREDEDVSAGIKDVLENEGIEVRLNAECAAFEKRGSQIALTSNCPDGAQEIVGSHVLLAIGRIPNTDDLGLEAAGVEPDKRGFIKVDDQLRTNVPGIWALGDANGRGAFTHTSYNDYEILAANLFDDDPRRVSDRITAYGLFTDPPLGRVGMTEREGRESGRKALIGTMMKSRVGRAKERSETQGFMKVLVDAQTQRILGASILGIGGDEIIHSLLDVMYADAPYTVIQRTMHIHPTVTELIPTMLADLRPLGWFGRCSRRLCCLAAYSGAALWLIYGTVIGISAVVIYASMDEMADELQRNVSMQRGVKKRAARLTRLKQELNRESANSGTMQEKEYSQGNALPFESAERALKTVADHLGADATVTYSVRTIEDSDFFAPSP
jgi:pyruvate/2-oxoglutarate dehydrogenase complex dihydrolipoamide dehydrogenase (E3) component